MKLEEEIFDNIDKLYMTEIKQIPLLSSLEERELSIRISHGDLAAKEKMIISNLRLVVSIANRHLDTGIPFLDLVSEGNIGLIKAVNRYDGSRGIKFSTYATYWINNAIFNYIASNEKNIRIPVVTYNKVGSLRKIMQNLLQELHREPTTSEVALKMNVSNAKIMELQDIKKFNMISINELIQDDDNRELENIISNLEESLDEIIFRSTLRDYMLLLFEKCNLNEIEKNVLKLRFGFVNDRMYTFEEIGKKYNMTKQRVYQINRDAIDKIRISEYIIDFLVYMQNPDVALKNLAKYRNDYYQKIKKRNNENAGR